MPSRSSSTRRSLSASLVILGSIIICTGCYPMWITRSFRFYLFTYTGPFKGQVSLSSDLLLLLLLLLLRYSSVSARWQFIEFILQFSCQLPRLRCRRHRVVVVGLCPGDSHSRLELLLLLHHRGISLYPLSVVFFFAVVEEGGLELFLQERLLRSIVMDS